MISMSKAILTLFCLISFFSLSAQVSYQPNYWQLELERKAEIARIQDSTFHAQDSLQMLWIIAPSKNRPNQFLDSLKEVYTIKGGSYSAWKMHLNQGDGHQEIANVKPYRAVWVIGVFGLIIALFATIKLYYTPQLVGMMHAFFSNTAFFQLNKEENIYNKWPFVLLFILFSFVVGLFVFLGAEAYYPSVFSGSVQFFLLISVAVFLIVLLKVLATKALGYIFEVKALAKEYISILYLCYFNGALYLIPVLLIFLFSTQDIIDILFIVSCLLLTLLFLLQVLRTSIYTLKAYKFSKFYLILYFCTLEIGPMLILIKLLDYNLI